MLRQLHAPTILLLEKKTALLKQKDECEQGPVWMKRWKRYISFLYLETNHNFLVLHPITVPDK
jgi:hypothetical protein